MAWGLSFAGPPVIRSRPGPAVGAGPGLFMSCCDVGRNFRLGSPTGRQGSTCRGGQKLPVRGGSDHCCDVACCGSGFFVTGGLGRHGRSGGADFATVVAYVRGPETVESWGTHHRQGASTLRLIPTRGPCRNSAISGAGSRRQPKADIAPLPMMLTGFPDSSRLAPKADPIFPGPQARRFSATFPRRRRASSWPAMTCPPRSSTADASPSGEHTRFTQRCMP